MTPELKLYLIGFIGSADFRKVRAISTKEAKNIFAQYHGIRESIRITSHKWTGDNWNRSIKDSRPTITRELIPV